MLNDFLEIWKKAYHDATGLSYRETPREVVLIVKQAHRHGTLKGVDYEKFSRKAIAYLMGRSMRVTIENAINRINDIALAMAEPLPPAHRTFDAAAYRRELEEISGEQLKEEEE